MTPSEADERLAAVLKNVKGGRLVEVHWELFRVAYFREYSDLEAAELLREWCDRHGLKPAVRLGRTDMAGKTFYVMHLQLQA